MSETFNIIVIDNNMKEVKILKIYNLLGQEVDILYEGIKIIIYSDNTIIKKY